MWFQRSTMPPGMANSLRCWTGTNGTWCLQSRMGNGGLCCIRRRWVESKPSPRRAITDAFFTPDGTEVVLVAEKLELGEDPFEMVGAKSVGAEVQFLDAATGAVTRRFEGAAGCFLSQAWVSTDGNRLMVLQRCYTATPRTHAEKQAQHLREGDLAAALLTVSLDRHPRLGNHDHGTAKSNR